MESTGSRRTRGTGCVGTLGLLREGSEPQAPQPANNPLLAASLHGRFTSNGAISRASCTTPGQTRFPCPPSPPFAPTPPSSVGFPATSNCSRSAPDDATWVAMLLTSMKSALYFLQIGSNAYEQSASCRSHPRGLHWAWPERGPSFTPLRPLSCRGTAFPSVRRRLLAAAGSTAAERRVT